MQIMQARATRARARPQLAGMHRARGGARPARRLEISDRDSGDLRRLRRLRLDSTLDRRPRDHSVTRHSESLDSISRSCHM